MNIFVKTASILILVSCGILAQKNHGNTAHKKANSTYKQVGIIPAPKGWINDFENILTPTEEQVLDSLISDFEKKTTIEIALITMDSSMVTADNFDNFSLEIAREWGVGKSGKNNGVLIAISRQYSRMRIQNARGIVALISDLETKNIIRDDFIPYFKKDNYFQGMYLGISELIRVLQIKISDSH